MKLYVISGASKYPIDVDKTAVVVMVIYIQ